MGDGLGRYDHEEYLTGLGVVYKYKSEDNCETDKVYSV
jgi:hypothetical protein